jgi:hypothetical protein
MKKTALTLLTLAISVSAIAQAPNRAAAEKAILANENTVTAAFAKADAAAMQKHLLPDGVAVDPMGVTTVADLMKMLAEVKMQPGWKIEGSKFLWLDDNTVIHTYKWTGKGTVMGQPMPSPTWSSTLWVQRGGQWKGAFHQETLAMTPPPPPPPPAKK